MSFFSRFSRKTRPATDTRREQFLELVRDQDTLQSFASVADDDLVTFGRGMAAEAVLGEYYTAHGLATNVFHLPSNAVELATAAALVAYYPASSLGVLMRPSDASLRGISEAFAQHGIRLSKVSR